LSVTAIVNDEPFFDRFFFEKVLRTATKLESRTIASGRAFFLPFNYSLCCKNAFESNLKSNKWLFPKKRTTTGGTFNDVSI
jgi:hypothetical protein